MRRLTPLTWVWMNYIYANSSGIFCDPEDFLTRVRIIQDEKDEIWEQLSVKTYPDEAQMQMSREEIENQIEGIKDMAQEFAEYAKPYFPEPYFHGQDSVMEDLLVDVKKHGENSEYYIVAENYHELAYTAEQMLQEYLSQFDTVSHTEREIDFLKQKMIELQMSPKARENLQLVKQDLENRRENVSDQIEKKIEIIAETNLNPVYNAKCWECYEDGSGRLIDHNGKTLVSYDLTTSELMGEKLPFAQEKLYNNYSYDTCSFNIMREDAIRWLNNDYKRALEKANEAIEPYQQDGIQYKVVQGNPEYPYNVQIYNNGHYSGNGKFCKDLDAVMEFVESREAEQVLEKIEPLTPEQEGLIDTVEFAIDWGMPITVEQQIEYDRAIEQRTKFENMEQAIEDGMSEQTMLKQAEQLMEQVQTQPKCQIR